MRITKKEAKFRGFTEDIICEFHLHNPDQQAVTESCEDCVIIQDDCGCGIDASCEICNPKLIKNDV